MQSRVSSAFSGIPSKNGRKYLVAAAIAGVALYFWLGGDKISEKSIPSVLVKVVKPELKDVPMEVREVGTVIAYETVSVRSRLDSQIMEVKFNAGDEVQKGDLLFVLDDRTLKAQLNQLEANLQRDRAQLENARQQYERSRTLAKKGFESEANLDEAKAQFVAQSGTAGATQATIDSIRVQLEYTQITAPISGRTGTINVTQGNNVKANDTQPLVTINQVKPIRVQTAIAQRYLDALREAMSKGPVAVQAIREGGTETVDGTLEYIDNAVDQGSGTFVARAVFPNEDEKLWPGVFVTLYIRLGSEQGALVVPEVAVQHGQDGDFVFIMKENKAEKRPVEVARMVSGLAVISKGIAPEESVVVDGIMSLKDGSAVKVQDEKPAEAKETPTPEKP